MSRALLLSFFGLVVASGCSANSDANSGASGAAGTTAAAGTNASAGAAAAGASQGGSSSGAGGAGTAGTGGAVAAGGASGGTSCASAAGGTAGGSAGGVSTGGAGPCSAPGLVLCDDFEKDALGMLPMGMPWAASTCFDSSHVLKVDSAQAKSGTHSLVSQGIPYADCQLHADLGTLTDFYVRANVYYAAGAADQFEAHEVSAFELVPAASTDDPSIRVGFRGNTCLPEGVEVNISGGMEQTGCTGKTPLAGVWTCYELHVKASETGITADLSIDGVDQSYSNHGSPQMQLVNPDLKSVRYLRLGSRSYSGSYTPLIYVDDIAVGTQPIGCGAPK
ncbi:MAG: hypothetical protein ABJB12_11995 [Pseudomonadota bacterium]